MAKFTKREKKAYFVGLGYGAKTEGKRISGMTSTEKQSFKNGVAKAKGIKKPIKSNKIKVVKTSAPSTSVITQSYDYKY